MRRLSVDDHDRFERPRRTKPRTKRRPDFSHAPIGRVVTIDRGRYRCKVGETVVTATKARVLGRGGVIVGDMVRVDGDVSGADGTLGRIVEVIERTTMLRRSADDTDPYERPIVANADQIVIVTALAQPEPRLGMIDRILVAAYDAKVDAIIALTKEDLASPADIILAYRPLDVPIVTSRLGGDTSTLMALLRDKVSVFVGHSGVGKSTLVNALIPGVHRSTGVVNEVTGKGRHTSTSAIALELPGGGWIIDTPGVRSFGLSHVAPESVLGAFADLRDFTKSCPRGCSHAGTEPECGLDDALALGQITQQRLESFRRLEDVFR